MKGSGTVVGIDEAGRGAWVGPLVVGAVAVAPDQLERVRESGAKDSKALSPARREEVFARLAKFARVGSIELPPAEIDRYVQHGRLNELEAIAFADAARPFAPAVLRVDACDANAPRFGRSVARLAGPGFRVVARHRFDATDPLVGAASVVAKVLRDRAVARLAETLGADLGSGYPSDPRTVAYVRGRYRSARTLPPWLRASWATTKRVIGAGTTRPLDVGGP